MSEIAAKNWTLEPAEEQFPWDWPVEGELWRARHLPTDNHILLAFDEHGYLLRARMNEACTHDLMSEAMGLFGDYLKEAPIARHQRARTNSNSALS